MTSNFGELESGSERLGAVSGFVNEFIEAVRPGHSFDSFSHSETQQLTEYFECFGVPRDATVIGEGDEGDFLIILLTGHAVIYKAQGSHQRAVAEVRPGDMVGEISFIDGLPRTASCVTREPSDIAVMSRDNFRELQAAHPRLANKFLVMLLEQCVGRLRRASGLPANAMV